MNKVHWLYNKKGQAIMLSYMVVSTVLVYITALAIPVLQAKNLVERNRKTQEAFYMADGATEEAMSAFLQKLANFQLTNAVTLDTHTTTFTQFNNTTVTTTITRLDTNDREITEGNTKVKLCNFQIDAQAFYPLGNTNISVKVHQVFTRRMIPTFQHTVFYADDLELIPGKNMTLSGNIHTNKDMYLAFDGTGTGLQIDSLSLHSAGEIFTRMRKNSTATPSGTVAIRDNLTGAATYTNMGSLDSRTSTWEADATATWNGNVQSSVHGVTAQSAPAVASIQPTGYYALESKTSGKNNVAVINNQIWRNGLLLTEGTDYPIGTVTVTTNQFKDNRENKLVNKTVIDLSKLAGTTGTCTSGTGCLKNNLPEKGLLYATRDDTANTSTTMPGIELINGSTIPNVVSTQNTGLTVVSNDPVYIQGDYNTVNKKPASVIADAVNILSKDWNDDTNSTKDRDTYRTVEPVNGSLTTTINCAFVAGAPISTTGDYNGGLENYPRLHENWSNATLAINGSFVELWQNQVATGSWNNASYSPPTRVWAYDTAFNNSNSLPPYTPTAYGFDRVAWWRD